MRVEAITYSGGILKIRCSGAFGVGSEGNPSAKHLRESVLRWMTDYRDEPVTEIELDLVDVEYEWGDGPVSSMVFFLCRGVATIHFVAGEQNSEALKNLVSASNLPMFPIRERDA